MKRSPARVVMPGVVFVLLTVLLTYGIALPALPVADGRSPTTAPAGSTAAYFQKVYDARDLIISIPDFENVTTLGVQPDTSPSQPAQKVVSSDVPLEQVLDAVRARFGNDKQATVRSVKGQLLVNATGDEHGRIQALLEQIHRARLTQITIDSRFISIDPKSLAGINPGLEDLCDGAKVSGVSATISDAESAELIKAAPNPVDSPLVTSPRITLFQNQRAYVLESTETSYVREFAAKTNSGAKSSLVPVIGTVTDGALVDVRASCDATASTVSLDYHAQIAKLLGFTEKPWNQSPSKQNLNVQVPNLRNQSAHQLISVASGQSALIWLGETGKADERTGSESFVIVTPTILPAPHR